MTDPNIQYPTPERLISAQELTDRIVAATNKGYRLADGTSVSSRAQNLSVAGSDVSERIRHGWLDGWMPAAGDNAGLSFTITSSQYSTRHSVGYYTTESSMTWREGNRGIRLDTGYKFGKNLTMLRAALLDTTTVTLLTFGDDGQVVESEVVKATPEQLTAARELARADLDALQQLEDPGTEVVWEGPVSYKLGDRMSEYPSWNAAE